LGLALERSRKNLRAASIAANYPKMTRKAARSQPSLAEMAS